MNSLADSMNIVQKLRLGFGFGHLKLYMEIIKLRRHLTFTEKSFQPRNIFNISSLLQPLKMYGILSGTEMARKNKDP